MADTDTIVKPDDATKPSTAKSPDSTPPKAAPPQGPINYDRVGKALGLGDMQRTLAEDRANIERLTPSTPALTPPPRTPPPSDPFQAFGQPAMWLAALGGLLTRHPLTSAIKSAGAVMESVHKQDEEAIKRGMEEWRINSENAMKMVKYEQDAYKSALAKYATDARAGEAEIRTLASAFKNAALEQVYATEGMDGVKRYLSKSSGDANLLEERRLKLQEHFDKVAAEKEALKAWQDANPDATPQQVASAKLMITHGKDPTEMNIRDFGPPQEVEITDDKGDKKKILAQQDKRTGGWVTADETRSSIQSTGGAMRIIKGSGDKPPEAGSVKANRAAIADDVSKDPEWKEKSKGEQAAEIERRFKSATMAAGSAGAIQKDVESDLKALHPDWSAGRIAIAAKGEIAAGTAHAVSEARMKAQADHPPLTQETANMEAEIMLLTGTVPGGGRLGQPAMTQVMNAAGELIKNSGHTVADYMAKRAEYKADTASIRALATRTDALDAAAKATKREFSDVVIPNIPKTSEPLNMQLLTRWVRSGESQFGDTEVPVYMAALISGLDEYAKVLAGATGAAGSTDASRAQAVSVIPLGATTDQIKSIIERAIYPTIDIKIDTYNKQKEQISARMANIGADKPKTESTTAPATKTPKPAGMADDQILAAARKRIAANPGQKDAVISQLRAWGINTGGL